MKPPLLFSLLGLALLGLVAYSGLNRPPEAAPSVPTALPSATYPPGREPMVLPENYRDNLVLYAQVDRSDTVARRLYISPAALDAVRAGEDFPDYTQIVIEAYDASRNVLGGLLRDTEGRFIPGSMRPQIHIAEKRSTWFIEDLASSSRVGDWNFAAFDHETGLPTGENRSDCFTCHDSADEIGFTFTRTEIARYAQTGEMQYRYCGLPERIPCRF